MKMTRAIGFLYVLVACGLTGTLVAGDLQSHFESALELRSDVPDLFAGSPGLLVVTVEAGSQAETLGIQIGDIWVTYDGQPIRSLESLLEALSQYQDASGTFLRYGQPKRLSLRSGPLGVGLSELAHHGLKDIDAALFFDLLKAGYAQDRDRLMAYIRAQREAFVRIAQHFGSLSERGGPDAAQLRHWHESIETYLELDEHRREHEEALAAIEAERSAVEQQLDALREAQLINQIQQLQQQSQKALQAGNHDAAVAHAQEAIELARSLPIPDDPKRRAPKRVGALTFEAGALLDLSTALSARGEQLEGIKAADLALQRARSATVMVTAEGTSHTAIDLQVLEFVQDIEALALDLLGVLYRLAGDPKAAREVGEQRLALAAADRLSRIDALRAIGGSYRDAREYLEAIPYLKEAKTLVQAGDDSMQLNQIETALANIYTTLGDYEQAMVHAEKALEAARRFPLPQHISTFEDLPDWLMRWYAELKTMTLNLLGSIECFMLNRPNRGMQFFQQAAEVAEKYLKGTSQEATILSSLAAAYAVSGEIEKAVDYAKRALVLHQQKHHSPLTDRLDRQLEAFKMIILAEVLTSQRDFKGAETYLQQAEAISNDFYVLISLRESRARALILAGEATEAEALLRENIAWIETARRSLSESELMQISFADAHSTNYDLLQQSLLDQERYDDLLELAEKRRGRTLFERWVTPGHMADSPSELDLDGMRHLAAAEDASLVVYSLVYDTKTFLLPSRIGGYQSGAERELLIWVIQPDGTIEMRRQLLAGDQDFHHAHLSDLVGTLRSATPGRGRGFEVTKPSVDPNAALKHLYKLLIAPIADLLPDKGEHLVFVPQGPLLMVPFAALQDASGHYLVEHYAIVTVPALKILELTRQIAQALVSEGEQGPPLIVGNPKIQSRVIDAYHLGSLPGAEHEAKRIAELFDAQPLLAEDATKEAVLERLPMAGLLHFATHGLLDGRSAGSPPGAIVLAPDGQDNGLLGAGEIMDLSLKARLAVLSACDTGRGRLTGEGVVGLPYALIRAGVPSVLVSLWAVPDDSTAVLMSHFYIYRARAEQESLAEALRQAMLATMAADEYREPWQWAAFTLIGQWKTP